MVHVLNVQRPGIVKQQLFAPVQGNKTCKIYAAFVSCNRA